MKTLTFALLVSLMCGCSGPRPLKPGTSRIASTPPAAMAGGAAGLSSSPSQPPAFVSEMKQPENPAQAASQNFEETCETVLPIPAQSTVTESVKTVATKTSPPVEQVKTITLSEPSEQKTKVVRKAGTTVGAAQKDTAREIGAKLSSMKGIMWVGVLVFLFGAASLVYPPLRAIVGSVTTSAMACGSGLVLIVLPTLVAGNETLILFTVLGVLLAYFFAHRHGKLQGFVDANQNGIDDRKEKQT